MADVNEEALKKILREFKERITALEERVHQLESSDDDNHHGERTEGHPYFGGHGERDPNDPPY
jgi:hypothetical protein